MHPTRAGEAGTRGERDVFGRRSRSKHDSIFLSPPAGGETLRGLPYRARGAGRKGWWGPSGFAGCRPDLLGLPCRASLLGGGVCEALWGLRAAARTCLPCRASLLGGGAVEALWVLGCRPDLLGLPCRASPLDGKGCVPCGFWLWPWEGAEGLCIAQKGVRQRAFWICGGEAVPPEGDHPGPGEGRANYFLWAGGILTGGDAACSSWWAMCGPPYSTTEMSGADKFLGPCLAHPLGTDNFGRDLLSRIMEGGKHVLHCLVRGAHRRRGGDHHRAPHRLLWRRGGPDPHAGVRRHHRLPQHSAGAGAHHHHRPGEVPHHPHPGDPLHPSFARVVRGRWPSGGT